MKKRINKIAILEEYEVNAAIVEEAGSYNNILELLTEFIRFFRCLYL